MESGKSSETISAVLAPLNFWSGFLAAAVTFYVFVVLIFPNRYVSPTTISFTAYTENKSIAGGEFTAQGIESIQSAPQSEYCKEAKVALLAPVTAYRTKTSFLTTAIPNNWLRCNSIPLEISFIEPVRIVTLRFHGANQPYELVAYRKDGSVIRKKYRNARPYDYNKTFQINVVSTRPNISRITFGYERALTMVREIRFSQ